MKHAFSIHNRMGNCHDEDVYQNELLHLIQKDGILVQKEVTLQIGFRSFSKTYFLDLLIEGLFIYELKAQASLNGQCRSQLINYQLISEKPYGKLINFGGQSVEQEFVTSTLTKTERQALTIDKLEWDEATDPDQTIYALACNLISDWGSRLDPALYSEALLALLTQARETRTEIVSGERIVGTKQVNLVEPGMAFKITTSKKPDPLRIQFQKFVNHTNLTALQWINLNRNHISFITLKKQ